MTGWWHYDERRMRDEGSVFKPEFYAEKCPNGIGEIGPLHNLSIEEDARMYAAVQEYFRKKTRLGIPAILHDEADIALVLDNAPWKGVIAAEIGNGFFQAALSL